MVKNIGIPSRIDRGNIHASFVLKISKWLKSI